MKNNKIFRFLFGNKKVESTQSVNIVERYMSEFDSRFGFILRNGIDSREEYEKTKSYYVSKKINSSFPVQGLLFLSFFLSYSNY